MSEHPFDERFNLALIDDVLKTLADAGYQCTDEDDRARCIFHLFEAARAFEGRDEL